MKTRKGRTAYGMNNKPLQPFVCTHCKGGNCSHCVDVARAAFDMEAICHCKERGHGGEPLDQQIKDPETGTVYAPGLSVTEGGEVNRG